MSHSIYIHNFHLDGYGHVNNARYLEFLEQARWHYFQQLNMSEILRQIQLVVVHLDIQYRQAIECDETILIDTHILSAQSRRLILQQIIRLSGSLKIAAQANVTLMPTQNGKTFRLPEAVLQKFNQLISQEK